MTRRADLGVAGDEHGGHETGTPGRAAPPDQDTAPAQAGPPASNGSGQGRGNHGAATALEDKPATLSERLSSGLLALIAEQGLKPGDALPTVRELAARFAVTAPTIREALRRLQATDAVQLRHGSGVYVGRGIYRTLMPNPNFAPMRDELVLQLVEARLTIEPGIAALAATHRSEDDLTQLELALDTALRDMADTRPHLNFHRELAGASGNQVLFEVVDSLLVVRSREQRMVRLLIHDRRRDYDQHLAILHAIRARDASAAERLTRQHLQQLRDDTAAQLG